MDEISLLKNEMQMINKGCTDGAVKMAKIAKFEFEKVDEENLRLRTLLHSVMEKKYGECRNCTKSEKCPTLENC